MALRGGRCGATRGRALLLAPGTAPVTARLYAALVAVLLGSVVALALAVPYVAVQYRRRGTVRGGPTLLALASVISLMAVVSYTLRPLPPVGPGFCANGGAGVQLRPGRFVTDVVGRGVGGPSALLHDVALRQLVFNVVLFVPLGMFLRHLSHRGVVLTTPAGLVVSVLVETTQLTGDWFAYPCVYCVFDVDDLLANTTGALLGALTAPVLRLVPGQQLRDPGVPRPVTARRRLLGMVVDGVLGVVAGLVLGSVHTAVVLVTGTTVAPRVDTLAQTLAVDVVPALALLGVLLSTHRTPGEMVVRLRPREPVGAGRALVRWLLGIGGLLLLAGPSVGVTPVTVLLVAASVVAVARSHGHRGVAYAAVGWELVDDRVPTVGGRDG